MKKLGVIFVFALLIAPTVASAAIIGKPTNNLGLVGYWSFEDGSGSSIGDMSGNKYSGALRTTGSQNPSWTSGKTGSALNFPGSGGGYVDLGQPSGLLFSGSFTISVWLNSTSTSQGGIVGRFYNTNGNRSYRVVMDALGEISVALSNNGTAITTCVSSATVNDGSWHHVVVAYAAGGGTVSIYKDGVLDAASPCTSMGNSLYNNGVSVQFGTSDTDTGPVNDFVGKLDEIRMYNRSVGAAEAIALYQAGAAKIGLSAALDNGSSLSSGLVGHWTFDGGVTNWTTGQTADSSGNGNTGQMFSVSTSGTPTIGALGQAFSFGLRRSYVRVASTTALQFTSGPFSVSGWIYATSTATQMIAFHGLGCSTFASWYLSIGGNENQTNPNKYAFGFNTSNAGATAKSVATTGNASTSRWMHLTGTYDGSSLLSLYINGVLQATSSASGNPYASYEHLYLGEDPGCSGRFVANMLDDLRVYNRALTASEVRQLYGLGGQKIGASSQTLSSGSSLSRGLVGLWTFDGSDVTDKVYDKSGSTNNGSFKGGSTSSAKTIGKLGQALRFNGSSSQVNVGSAASLDDIDPITISAWIRPDTDMTAGEIFDKTADGGLYTDGPDLWYDYAGSNRLLFAQGFTGGNSFAIWFVDASPIRRGEWNHVVVTYSRASAANSPTFYINGVQQTTTADGTYTAVGSARSDAAADAVIGAYGSINTTSFFKGGIDDVRVYNRVLSASEVKQLYNLGK